jgi:hypothetical protein
MRLGQPAFFWLVDPIRDRIHGPAHLGALEQLRCAHLVALHDGEAAIGFPP